MGWWRFVIPEVTIYVRLQNLLTKRLASQFLLVSPEAGWRKKQKDQTECDWGLDSSFAPLPLARLCRCLRSGDVLNEKWRKQVEQNDFERPCYLSCSFLFRNERSWTKKSARVSEKLASPDLPCLLVATLLLWKMFWTIYLVMVLYFVNLNSLYWFLIF